MSFNYWLPDEFGKKIEYKTNNQSIVIIGANGSGKSKLGAWIEQQDFEKVHRIGAQRNLNFQENIPLKNYKQAEDRVFYGTDNDHGKSQKGHRWNWGDYTTNLINDFEDVLAAMLAKKNNENDYFVLQCRKAEKDWKQNLVPPITVIDKLKGIWNRIFPQRQLEIKDSKFYAVFNEENGEKRYPANQMSDGERAVLYLSSQVLCVPENKILIIDEPEIHLHKSIMNHLWMVLEQYRPDCLFLYITHDTEFAALHNCAEKLWIREYNGKSWRFEKIENDDLPEELLLNILGARKSVLFVEGDKNSYDTKLYTLLYPNCHVVPCGSCTQVIARTKAFNNNSSLHRCKVYGIIDRDFRTEYEIEKYAKDSIFTIDVAEVENLFIVEELIRFMAQHMGKEEDDIFNQIKEYVINQRFAKQINSQICQSVVSEIKYILSGADLSNKSEEAVRNSLDEVLASLDYEKIKENHKSKFENVLKQNNYKETIKVFNEKNIAQSIGHYLGIDNKEYCQTIISLLARGGKTEIIMALENYLPSEIPR